MTRLYMSCVVCTRKQAHGLLSNASWAIVEVRGASHRVCPSCREAHGDWEERARTAVMQVSSDGTTERYGATYR
jgi:transcriptional regulator NrdR family protein